MSISDNLLKEFCQSIGMEPLGFDKDKQRSLSFDEKIVITFLDEDEKITALCYVANVTKPEDMRKLLENNFLPEAHGGARFALEPHTDRIIMTKQWEAVKTTIPQFSDELEHFVNSAIKCQQYFADGGAPAEKTEAETAKPVDSLSAAYQAI